MKELKNFNILSVGKVFGLFGLVVSVIQMIFLKIISMNATIALQYGIGANSLTLGAMLQGVAIATAVYFVTGLVIALIYNLVAKYVGGIMFDLSDAVAPVKKKVKMLNKIKMLKKVKK